MSDDMNPLDVNERNANNLERVAEACEAIAFFLNALLSGKAEIQTAPPDEIMTHDGLVELR